MTSVFKTTVRSTALGLVLAMSIPQQIAFADDCLISIHKAHIYYRDDQEDRIKKSPPYESLAAALRMRDSNLPLTIRYQPQCIMPTGVRYFFEGYIILQNDNTLVKTYTCNFMVDLNFDARNLISPMKMPNCHEESREVISD